MHNGVGERSERRSPGTSDTKRTKVLLTLKERGTKRLIKNYDVDL
jgi:hypothetical protein